MEFHFQWIRLNFIHRTLTKSTKFWAISRIKGGHSRKTSFQIQNDRYRTILRWFVMNHNLWLWLIEKNRMKPRIYVKLTARGRRKMSVIPNWVKLFPTVLYVDWAYTNIVHLETCADAAVRKSPIKPVNDIPFWSLSINSKHFKRSIGVGLIPSMCWIAELLSFRLRRNIELSYRPSQTLHHWLTS